MQHTPLSKKHLEELERATATALAQWAPQLTDPHEIVSAMDRVLLFLKQQGQPSAQARQVASLAFVVGEQVVKLGGWAWVNLSDDNSFNPAIISPDGTRAALLIDALTFLVMGHEEGSLTGLVRACLMGLPHALLQTLS